MDRFGADITHQIGYALRPCSTGGCAGFGSLWRSRGGHRIPGQSMANNNVPAWIVAHELGHVMGLAHSAQQGENGGTFHWSRGHHLNRYAGRHSGGNPLVPMGTIMSYGHGVVMAYSDPASDCYGEPCECPGRKRTGRMRGTAWTCCGFRSRGIARRNRIRDGDGFVDDADIAPRDREEWVDSDGDGIGDKADPDDDNDDAPDINDRWPYDPLEWEDIDGDGVGDNADDDVVEVEGSPDPFRDAALRGAFERALGKSAGENISASELAGLQSLSAYHLGIRDLSGIEHATGLTHLTLVGHALTDLSPWLD